MLYGIGESGRSFLADTPGFSMIDLMNFNFFPTENLPWTFREFRPFLTGCRYTKCTHTKEEGCAVLEAVRSGVISPLRHEHYVRMREEMKAKPDWKRKKEGFSL